MSNWNLYILILCFTKCALSANILYIEPVPSPSHHVWNRILSLELVKQGHNVTVIGHDPEKKPVKNYTFILFEGVYDKMHEENFDYESIHDKNPFSFIKLFYDWSTTACKLDMNTKGLKQLLDYPKDFKFDLIVIDITCNQCAYPIINRFGDPPVIGVTAFLLPPYLAQPFGSTLQPAIIPWYTTLYTDKMNFKERFLNFIYTYTDVFVWRWILMPTMNQLAKERFGDNMIPLEETERKISLLLCNLDPTLDYPQALTSNVIPVGGLHMHPPKTLPQDLKSILDNAKNGVIFFSLGTNIRSDKLGYEKRLALLNAFKKLPQTIIWKFESKLDDLPSNVIIKKWLPQNDILGHPNVRLFITHGGALSTQEAMYHSVPVVGIPFMADQHANMKKLVYRNLGLILQFADLTEETVYKTVSQVLNNPLYKNNMIKISQKFRDQPQTPLERAVFWIEYVLRHGDVESLVPATRDMPLYQTLSLDVIFVLLGILVTVIFLIFKIICKICNLFVKAPKQKTN